MKINFIPNPAFKHPAPEIRVGSVVKRLCNGAKGPVFEYRGLGNYAVSSHPFMHNRWLAHENELTVLPERAYVGEQGEWEYAPITPPAPPYSWDQYPPRAGMVVERINDGYRVLFASVRDSQWVAVDEHGQTGRRSDAVGDIRTSFGYHPRPDLMPQFVEGE